MKKVIKLLHINFSGQYCQYSKETLIEAVLEVKSNKMTVTEASKRYCIPRKTISNHVLGKVEDFRPTGRETALSGEEEASIVGYLKYMSRHNFPLRRSEVRGLIVVSYLNDK